MTTDDPASMRYVAGQLRVTADELCGQAGRVASGARTLVYEGPSGENFHHIVASSYAGVHSEAEALYTLASRLDSAASVAEIQIRQASIT
jgi:uncharacterized protein YukE